MGRKNAPKETVRLRRVSASVRRDLRAAVRSVRDGSRDGGVAPGEMRFELTRGYSNRGRALARLAVGLGVVVAMLSAVVAFVVPDATAAVLVLVTLPALMVAGVTAGLSSVYDTGVRIGADGVMRVEGWGGIRELDLASFARVTVAEEPSSDIGWTEG